MSSGPRRAPGTGVLLAMATAVISGIAVFVNGFGVRAWAEVSDPTTYTTLKNTIAAVLLAVGAAVWGRGAMAAPVVRRHWRGLAVVAVVGGSVPFVLFFEGLARATSTDAAFIHKTLVIWVVALAIPLLGERVRLPHLAAVALIIWGQAALGGGVGTLGFGSGEMLILAATLLWAAETVLAKRLLASVPSMALAVSRMAGGALVLILFSWWRGGLGALGGITIEHGGWVLFTAVTLAAYVATWYAALARAPAVDVTAVLAGGAIVTALLEAGLRGATVSPLTGAVLITLGVGLVLVRWRRPAAIR